MNFCFTLFRALKRPMFCSQILIKTRHLACEINFKTKLDA
ncbi:hypothetical protein ATCC51561_1392 [Campylobacter concisus ATCC 51561]|nr:hypothetical protein ATCC51561_1392 [Campylobacter concisus ATCC 51561]